MLLLFALEPLVNYQFNTYLKSKWINFWPSACIYFLYIAKVYVDNPTRWNGITEVYGSEHDLLGLLLWRTSEIYIFVIVEIDILFQ